MLELTGVSRRFGGVEAVRAVELTVPERAVFGLIGPNGAGKTTLINVITGHLRPDAGDVRFRGRSIARSRPHHIARLGIARTFQGIRLFKGLTVRENVLVGRHARTRSDLVRRLVRFGPSRDDVAEALLRRVGLAGRADAIAGELPYGDQRRLEIARALASEPALLVLDEPAAGMSAAERRALLALLRDLVAEGLTILLIEHDVGLVMEACERIVVLNFGRKIADGAPADVRADRSVRDAYLGEPS